jgi:hypothetical protein
MSSPTTSAPSSESTPRRLTLRIYTFAHRLPQTIGKLPGGVTLPWVVGLQQFVVFFAGVWLLFSTRRAWAHLGLVPDALIMLGLPALLAWLARAAKLQGRGLIRGLLGLAALALAAATRHATAAGRGTRRTGTATRLQGRLITEPAPPPGRARRTAQPAGVSDVGLALDLGDDRAAPVVDLVDDDQLPAVSDAAVTATEAEAAVPTPAWPTRPGLLAKPPLPAPPPAVPPRPLRVQTAVSETGGPRGQRPVPIPAERAAANLGAGSTGPVRPARPGGGRYALIELVEAARLLRVGGGELIGAPGGARRAVPVADDRNGDLVDQGQDMADADEPLAAAAGGAR